MASMVHANHFNQWEKYTGPIEIFFDPVWDKDGKLMDFELQIRMADITLKRFCGTTLFDPSEETLEPYREHLYKIFDMHRMNFKDQVDTIGNEEEGLRSVFQHADTMTNYSSGKPWDNEHVIKTFFLDTYRASAGAAHAFIPEKDRHRACSFLEEATVWTGLAIYSNEENRLIGRAAYGSSNTPNISQSGRIIHKDYWGKGWGKQVEVALYVQAYVFSILLGFKLHSKEGKHDIQMFSSTLAPSPETDAKIKRLGLEVLKGPYNPYGEGQERVLVGTKARDLSSVLDKVILEKGIEHQVTINGKSPQDFLRGEQGQKIIAHNQRGKS